MSDARDKREARTLAVALLTLILLLVGAAFFAAPAIEAAVSPGMGLKSSAIVAFSLTITSMIVLMIAAGDGLLGEFQFALAGFFGFFLIAWLMIAWIF